MKKIFILLFAAFSLFDIVCEEKKTLKALPFDNKMYSYKDKNGLVESFEFYDGELIFSFLGKHPNVSYEYDVKKNLLTVNELSKKEIKDTSVYLYDKEKDCFTLYENNKTISDWILTKRRDFTAKDVEEFKALKAFFGID